MINQEQLINGIIRYIDAEVMPVLPTSGKWIAGTAVVLVSSKSTSLLHSLLDNPLVKSLDLVDENGMIDAETLFTALRCSAEKYGTMELAVPIVGTLRFTANDVDSLKRHIMGGI